MHRFDIRRIMSRRGRIGPAQSKMDDAHLSHSSTATRETGMKKLMAVFCCVLLAASSASLAQGTDKSTEKKAAATAKKEPSEKQKAQQQKMKDCNKQAADKKLKGNERKSFMSTCLKG